MNSQRSWKRQRGVPAARRLGGWLICALLTAQLAPAAAYEIGHTTIVWVDPARGNREIETEVFYPAEVPGEEVPVAEPPAGGFPVVSFGHGFLIPVDDYAFVWEGLAPEGYLVCLPRTEGDLSPSHLDLGLDLAFICGAMRTAGTDPASPFYNKVAERCAAGGHSMGGGASFLALAADPTLTCIFNFAAAETNPSAIEAAGQITAPALLLAGSLDCVTPPDVHQLPMYEALASGCKTYVELLGASHCQFAEYNFLCGLGEIGCPAPTITRSEQHALSLTLVTPWLDAFLAEDPLAWETFQTLLETQGGINYLQDCPVSHTPPPAASSGVARLFEARPNPVTGSVTIGLQLPSPRVVRSAVYGANGRCVHRWEPARLSAGRHRLRWDGRDERGRPVPTGCYFCRLDDEAGGGGLRFLIVR